MAPEAEVLRVVAAPAGVEDGRLRLSVCFSPRLLTAGDETTLSAFPAFASWPETISALRLRILIDGQPAPAVRTSPPPSIALWNGVFGDNTAVRPFTSSNLGNRTLRSYPAARIADFIQSVYTQVAVDSPEEFPTRSELGAVLEPATFLQPDGTSVKEELIRAVEDPVAHPPAPGVRTDLAFLYRFHQPPRSVPGTPIEPPSWDFHEAWSLLNQQPALQRLLGLVVDLAVTPPGPLGASATDGVVRVELIDGAGLAVGDVAASIEAPGTRTLQSDTLFLAAPRAVAPELVDGMFPFEDPDRFRAIIVDPDQAAPQLVSAADNLVRSQRRPSADTPERYSLPQLDSPGITLVELDTADRLAARAGLAAATEAAIVGADATLDAEDLLRGARIDVWDGARWRSLQERIGNYEFTDSGDIVELRDEGLVSQTGASRADEPDDLYLGESWCIWHGWSLAAPRPGRAIVPVGANGDSDQVEDVQNAPHPDFPLALRFRAAPGTLPTQRWGKTYRLRGRAVDLAGNDMGPVGPPDEADFTHATRAVPFDRLDPVHAPAALMQAPITAAETSHRIVIRSTPDDPAAPPFNHRHVAPARAPQVHAELDGRHDTTPGAVPDPDAYDEIIARDTSTFDDDGFGQPDSANHDRHFHATPPAVPYLPDPHARSMAVRILDHPLLADQSFRVDFPGGWPALSTVGLRVVEGSQVPTIEVMDGQQVLIVAVPKGVVVRARLSCGVDDSDLAKLAIWRWMTAELDAEAIEERLELAQLGRLWPLSPYQDIELVHALQWPLQAPEVLDHDVQRSFDDTFADVRPRLVWHVPSTGRIDARATWTEHLDLGRGDGRAAPDPSEEQREALLEVTTRRQSSPGVPTDQQFDINIHHELGDTKHRVVRYRPIATTSFLEYFRTESEVTLQAGAATVDADGAAIAENTELVRSAATGRTLRRDQDYAIDYANGNLAPADGGALQPLDVVIVSYATARVTNATPEPFEVDVPSSARPAPPKVLYVTPAHRWEAAPGLPTSSTAASTREGGWLRVWLDRPWLSSGAGELLAAILWAPTRRFPQAPAGLDTLVSRRGFDPLYASPAPDPILRPSDFPERVEVGPGLDTEELEGQHRVTAVGHRVAFDAERGLWFCDMRVDPQGAYLPWVRLALARYQPSSLPGVELSPIVLTDFAQLTPDRSATVMTAAGATSLTITVSGPAYTATAAGAGTTRLSVRVERSRPELTDELTWEPIQSAATTLTAHQQPDGFTTWSGSIDLPAAESGRQRRLVIEEFELLIFDHLPQPVLMPRLVHVDTLPVPRGLGLLQP